MEAITSWWKAIKNFLAKPKNWLWIILGLVLLILTRTVDLTSLPIFCDEAIYIRWAQIAQSDGLMRFISLTDGKQPFQTWITIPFLKIFTDPLVAGRAQAVLAGLALPAVLILLTLLLFSKYRKNEANLATILVFFLVIFCPYLLFFNRMALAEAWLTLFAAGTILFSYLLGKTRRLDVALLTGAWLGMGLLVKSQAYFFLLLFPLGLLFVPIDFKKKKFGQAFKFLGLFLLAGLIAYFIYNVQRLSPWMYMIAQKNADFAISPFKALGRLSAFWQNLKFSLAWFGQYLTWPVCLLALLGLYLWFRKDWRQATFLAGWFFLPFGAINLIAQIYNSRYLAFLAFIPLLWAAYALVDLKGRVKKTSWWWLMVLLVFALPVGRSFQLITNPADFPFTQTDRGYLEGWTAGYGISQTVAIINQVAADQKVVVGTEGTFGLLSQGLEIYFAYNPNVQVIGYYPLPDLPPEELVLRVEEGSRAFFLVNNTAGDFAQDNFILVEEFAKVNDNGSLRLYEVVGQE